MNTRAEYIAEYLSKGFRFNESFDKVARKIMITVTIVDTDGLDINATIATEINGYLYDEGYLKVMDSVIQDLLRYKETRQNMDENQCKHSITLLGNDKYKKKVCVKCKKDLGYEEVQEIKVKIELN